MTKTTLTKIVAKSEVREAVGLWLCLPKQLLSGSGKEGFCFFLFCSVLFFFFFFFCQWSGERLMALLWDFRFLILSEDGPAIPGIKRELG